MQTEQTTDTTHKSRTYVFKFLTPLTPSVDKFFIITNKCTINVTTVYNLGSYMF